MTKGGVATRRVRRRVVSGERSSWRGGVQTGDGPVRGRSAQWPPQRIGGSLRFAVRARGRLVCPTEADGPGEGPRRCGEVFGICAALFASQFRRPSLGPVREGSAARTWLLSQAPRPRRLRLPTGSRAGRRCRRGRHAAASSGRPVGAACPPRSMTAGRPCGRCRMRAGTAFPPRSSPVCVTLPGVPARWRSRRSGSRHGCLLCGSSLGMSRVSPDRSRRAVSPSEGVSTGVLVRGPAARAVLLGRERESAAGRPDRPAASQ